MHTTQYTFTDEGLQRALSRLRSGGSLIIFGASKVNVLLSLRHLEEQNPATQRHNYLLFAPSGSADSEWKKTWDEMVLIIKKASLSLMNSSS